jgi:hypothetical protein
MGQNRRDMLHWDLTRYSFPEHLPDTIFITDAVWCCGIGELGRAGRLRPEEFTNRPILRGGGVDSGVAAGGHRSSLGAAGIRPYRCAAEPRAP